MNNLFLELTVVLILAGLISMIVSLLKQPSIIAYIITGLLVGPLGYYHLHQENTFHAMSEIGITLLLFMVGLQLDFSQLKRLGKTALLVGFGQVIITTLIGYAILKSLNFTSISAFYIALAFTFSSTIIVIKLLSEKKDLQSLYGKLVVGILLTQDFVAIVMLILLSSLNSGGGIYASLPLWQNLFMTFIRALIIILTVLWLSNKIFPKLLKHIGNNDELMLVFSLAWSLGLAAFMSLPVIGFSLEIGGFLAGLSLARSGVHYEISGKIKPIRDFFIIIFFIVLGSGLVLESFNEILIPALFLSVFVLLIKPLIVMVLLGVLGFKPRTGFFSAVSIAQVSEFSLILVASAQISGQVSKSNVGLVTLVAIISIAMSSYMVMFARQIYNFFEPFFSFFNFKNGEAEKHLHTSVLKNHVVLVGAHRLGHHLVEALKKQKAPFVVVDFNPNVVEQIIARGVLSVCGDINDPYIQEQINLPAAKLIISTVPDFDDNLALLEGIKRLHELKKLKPKLIFLAQDEAETKVLYEEGIDYVISPHFMGGLHLAKILTGNQIVKELKKLKEHHLRILSE